MDELVLRGFVTPEDFPGTDTEKLQSALDYAAKADIRKVIVTGDYVTDRPLTLPGQTHLVLENARIRAGGDFPLLQADAPAEYNSRLEWLYLQGKNGCLQGDLDFFNAGHIVLEDLAIHGCVTMEYCAGVRMERVHFSGRSALRIGRGCCNFILQYLTAETREEAAVFDTGISRQVVPGLEPELRNIVLRNCRLSTDAPAIALRATADYGILNFQADHITARAAAVAIGQKDALLPAGAYFNLTFTDLDTPAVQPILEYNPIKHCYIRT